MIILGVSGGPRGSHEPSITIIKDNKIICALQEERFNRFKNSISCFPYHSLKAVFKRTTIKPKDISKIIEETDKIQIKPSQIDLSSEINKVGNYDSKINLHAEIIATIHIEVVKQEEKK